MAGLIRCFTSSLFSFLNWYCTCFSYTEMSLNGLKFLIDCDPLKTLEDILTKTILRPFGEHEELIQFKLSNSLISLSWITAKNILQSQSSLRSTSHSYKEHMYSPMILFTGNGQKLWFHNAITHHNLMWMGEGTILTWYYHTTIRKKDQGKGFKAQPRVNVPQPLNFVTCGFSMWPHQ